MWHLPARLGSCPFRISRFCSTLYRRRRFTVTDGNALLSRPVVTPVASDLSIVVIFRDTPVNARRPSPDAYPKPARAAGAEGSANPHPLTTGASASWPSALRLRSGQSLSPARPNPARPRRGAAAPGLHVTPDAHELAMPRRAGGLISSAEGACRARRDHSAPLAESSCIRRSTGLGR
jgi:hypothetical protein